VGMRSMSKHEVLKDWLEATSTGPYCVTITSAGNLLSLLREHRGEVTTEGGKFVGFRDAVKTEAALLGMLLTATIHDSEPLRDELQAAEERRGRVCAPDEKRSCGCVLGVRTKRSCVRHCGGHAIPAAVDLTAEMGEELEEKIRADERRKCAQALATSAASILAELVDAKEEIDRLHITLRWWERGEENG